MSADTPINTPLARRRCFTHPAREAAAVCPECKRCFCRECVTEHDDRVICANCLARMTNHENKPRSASWLPLGLALQALLGFLLVWLLLHGLGSVLLSLPSAFHEGEMWESAR